MKTIKIKKLLVLAMMVLAVGYAYAFSPNVKFVGDKKLAIKLDNVSENTKLSIKDVNGYTLYSDEVEKSDKLFSRTFNLSDLPIGDYVVEIEGDVRIYTFKVVVAEDKVSSLVADGKVAFKPLAYERNNRVYVLKNNPELSPMSVTIYNRDGEVVFTETLEAKERLGRIYDFSKISGDYKIEMSSNEKTYIQTVSIK
jgi:hypothetical protein